MKRIFNQVFTRDENGRITTRSIVAVGIIAAAFFGMLTLSFTLFIALSIIWTGGILLSRSMDAKTDQIMEEVDFVISRHNEGRGDMPYHTQPSIATHETAVLTDLDRELAELLNETIPPEEVDRIERQVSQFDKEFTLSWGNVFHYLKTGKQKM